MGACRSRAVNLKEDLQLYVDKAIGWTATEAQISEAIARVRRDQFVHDDLIVETLKPAINTTWNFIQDLERYQPKSPPLINVHRAYTEAWRAHSAAMSAIVDAAEKKDYLQLAQANNDLREAQRSLANALADLARLLREAGIQPETPEKEQSSAASHTSVDGSTFVPARKFAL